jgi:glycosyltransferase involved in cell wall biosynthesis
MHRYTGEVKILHVIDSLDPRCGGPPAVVLRLAAAQASRGNQVGILTYGTPGGEDRITASMRGIPGIEGVAITSLDREQGVVRRALGSAAGAWCDQNLSAWDVAHIHGVWDPAVRACAARALRNGVPYVLVPHASLDPWALRQSPAKRIKKALAMLLQVRRIYDGATFVHSLNQAESAGIRQAGISSPLEIVPNGIFLDELRSMPSQGQFRAGHPELADDPFMLFLSRIHLKKGLDHLVAAFDLVRVEIPSLRLVIAGPDDGELANVQADIARRGLAGRVHVVGPVYGQDKYGALVDAAAFCLPSRMEGFSVAILEALACKCPVIISPQCNFPEVARNGAGIEVPLEPRAIADAMGRMALDRAAARTLGERGRKLVEDHYTWPAIADMLDATYRRRGVRG